MRTVLAITFTILIGRVSAQGELILNPPSSTQNMAFNDFVRVAPGEQLSVGIVTNLGAPIVRLSNSSVVWAKFFGPAQSRAWQVLVLANGDYLVVGVRKISTSWYDAVVMRLLANGNVVWSRQLDYLGKSEVAYYAVESPDGSIYVSGMLQYSVSDWRATLMKFNAGGNLLWTRMQPTAGYTACGNLIMSSTNVVIFGSQGNPPNTDPTVWVIDPNGLELLHRSFGEAMIQDASFDAVKLPGTDYLLSTTVYDGSVNRIGLLRLNASLSVIPGNTWKYEVTGNNFQSGRLLSSGNDIYMSGSLQPPGIMNSSFVAKLDQGLQITWAKRLATYVDNTARPLLDGSLRVVSTNNGWIPGANDIRISSLDTANGFPTVGNCEIPVTISPTRSPYSVVTTTFATSTWINLTSYFVSTGPTPTTLSTTIDSCYQIVLPIELVTFTGDEEFGQVRLRWSTATESGSGHFEVLRSQDSFDYEVVGIVSATGNSEAETNYSFIDEHPFGGTNYYRLRQVDTDGESWYSDVIAIQMGEEFANGEYEIIDMSGKVVLPNKMLAGGMYIVHVRGTNMVKKVVIDR